MKVMNNAMISRYAARGFSLIEIMVVVTLMAILVGIGTVVVMGRLEEGKISTARTQAFEIAKALDLYKLQTGNYPTMSEGLQVLTHPPRGKPLMLEIPKDPWGQEYNYAIPGTRNSKSFDVWSNGPGGEESESSEIGNWRAE
jgi:general secretion pathway protein G